MAVLRQTKIGERRIPVEEERELPLALDAGRGIREWQVNPSKTGTVGFLANRAMPVGADIIKDGWVGLAPHVHIVHV
jgi:hypothetical protein